MLLCYFELYLLPPIGHCLLFLLSIAYTSGIIVRNTIAANSAIRWATDHGQAILLSVFAKGGCFYWQIYHSRFNLSGSGTERKGHYVVAAPIVSVQLFDTEGDPLKAIRDVIEQLKMMYVGISKPSPHVRSLELF